MTAGVEVFLDTNIWIYAAQGKAAEPEKFAIARRIIVEEDFGSSGQVLSEFFVNVTRKGARPLTIEQAERWIRVIAKKPCQAVDAHLVLSGIALKERYAISFWDAMILGAAERLGAKTMYSEDLNHGQLYGQVRVINPFRPV